MNPTKNIAARRFALPFIVLMVLCPPSPACTDGPDDSDPDASTHRLKDAGSDALLADVTGSDTAALDGSAGCRRAVPNPSILGHAEGQDCFFCHDNMGGNLHFSLAGTAYENAAGQNPLAGATVTVTDSSGKVIDMVTGSNGNFTTLEPVTFPITVVLSKCPAIVEMPNTIDSRQGCNSCHGAANRIYLP